VKLRNRDTLVVNYGGIVVVVLHGVFVTPVKTQMSVSGQDTFVVTVIQLTSAGIVYLHKKLFAQDSMSNRIYPISDFV
jgi:hypothetical protein